MDGGRHSAPSRLDAFGLAAPGQPSDEARARSSRPEELSTALRHAGSSRSTRVTRKGRPPSGRAVFVGLARAVKDHPNCCGSTVNEGGHAARRTRSRRDTRRWTGGTLATCPRGSRSRAAVQPVALARRGNGSTSIPLSWPRRGGRGDPGGEGPRAPTVRTPRPSSGRRSRSSCRGERLRFVNVQNGTPPPGNFSRERAPWGRRDVAVDRRGLGRGWRR